MPKKIDPALRERAVRLVREHRSEYPSTSAAVAAVAKQVGVGHESLRRWVAQADIDAGDRDGVTSVEAAEIKRLEAENRRLREDVAILKVSEQSERAAESFVGEFDLCADPFSPPLTPTGSTADPSPVGGSRQV